ncbi:hypothetical protein [Parashewanella tropica]|uniref:hypothetical protein n=1 Tax=Parashewanella tropica TaxID=2547970 RepID=UPI001059315B|nr:hypothetical protein [Parashewanella tropica]
MIYQTSPNSSAKMDSLNSKDSHIELNFSKSLIFCHPGNSHCMTCSYDVKVTSKQVTDLARFLGQEIIIVTDQIRCKCKYTVRFCSRTYKWTLSSPTLTLSPPYFSFFREDYIAQKALIEHLVERLNKSHDLCDHILNYKEESSYRGKGHRRADLAIRDGVNVNACQYGFPNETPLCEAILEGLREMVKTLLDAGALVTTPHMKGRRTPLHLAVMRAKDGARQVRFDILDELLKHSPPLDWPDDFKETPMDLANRDSFTTALAKLQQCQAKLNNYTAVSTPTPLWSSPMVKEQEEIELVSLVGKFKEFNQPIYLRTSKDQWVANQEHQFTRTLQGNYVVQKDFEADECIEFKIASEDWADTDFGGGATVEVNKTVSLKTTSIDGNLKFNVAASGTYLFTLIPKENKTEEMTLYIEQLTQPQASTQRQPAHITDAV